MTKIEVEREMLVELYNFMTARMTHPHGEDVFATKQVPHPKEEGKVTKERIHTHHYHRANMAQSLEHNWHHRLGELLKIHTYEVVER